MGYAVDYKPTRKRTGRKQSPTRPELMALIGLSTKSLGTCGGRPRGVPAPDEEQRDVIRKICQFVVLLVVSPLVLFSLGLCLAWAAAAEFLGWNDHV